MARPRPLETHLERRSTKDARFKSPPDGIFQDGNFAAENIITLRADRYRRSGPCVLDPSRCHFASISASMLVLNQSVALNGAELVRTANLLLVRCCLPL